MRFIKSFMAAGLVVSMTAAPVLAQSAVPPSVGSRAGAAIQDGNALISEDEQVWIAAALIAIMAAAILLSKQQGDDEDLDNPVSP